VFTPFQYNNVSIVINMCTTLYDQHLTHHAPNYYVHPDMALYYVVRTPLCMSRLWLSAFKVDVVWVILESEAATWTDLRDVAI